MVVKAFGDRGEEQLVECDMPRTLAGSSEIVFGNFTISRRYETRLSGASSSRKKVSFFDFLVSYCEKKSYEIITMLYKLFSLRGEKRITSEKTAIGEICVWKL